MIRVRRLPSGTGVALGVAGALALGTILALGATDRGPGTSVAYQAQLADTANAAEAALSDLAAALDAALDAARSGAATTVSGDVPPSASFQAAAERLEVAAPLADDAARRLARVAGMLAIGGEHDAPQLFLAGPDLASISAQLRATGDAADAFADMRHASRSVLDQLRGALAAITRDDRAAATSALDAATAALAEVRAWPGALATLPFWTRTVHRLLRALRDVVAARVDGDAAAERHGLAAYRRAAQEASRADRALAIALSEGGGAVAQPALARLADAVGKVAAARNELVPMLATEAR